MCKLSEDDIAVGACVRVVGHESTAAEVPDRQHYLLKYQFSIAFAVMLDRVLS